MLYVMANPGVYRKLQSEIDSTICSGPIISDEKARTLPYLQAVIKEGARMCPPATGMLNKRTPPEGDTINGRFVPGGVDIGQCAWGLQRSKTVYGIDSMLFRPERWLDNDEEKVKNMERHNFVFGAGSRTCKSKSLMSLIQTY